MSKTLSRLRDDERGFTLIELLVVVIIIGILAAIAIPAFLGQREGAWRSSVESDLRNVAIVMETCLSQEDLYPADVAIVDTAELCPGQDVNLSDNVTVTIVGGGTDQAYTLDGEHASIPAGQPGAPGTPIVYDSATGGL